MNRPPDLPRAILRTFGTIRWRLALWSVVLLALAMLAFGSFLYVSLRHSLEDELDRSLAAAAAQVALLDLGNGQQDPAELTDTLPPGTVVGYYDANGARLLISDARRGLPSGAVQIKDAARGQTSFTSQLGADGSTWRLYTTPVFDGPHVIAVLQVAGSAADTEQALRQLVLLMALAVPALLLLALGGGLFLAGRALNPIDRVTRTAAVIGIEDLSQRLRIHGTDEVARLASTFDAMLDRLQAAFVRQRQFTADASHELRTPLALLRAQIGFALERRQSPEQYKHVLESLATDAERMSELLGELLTLARADAGQEVLARESLQLEQLVEEVTASLEPLAHQRQVRLEVPATSARITVLGDQARLTQLLINLVDNGLKYTPPGGHVTVALERAGKEARLSVRDTGIGIAPEHLPHLFERFYRVDPARARGGSGLGLAISHWIVESHGGRITVESTPGAGTAVSVYLPATGAPSDAARPPTPAGAEAFPMNGVTRHHSNV